MVAIMKYEAGPRFTGYVCEDEYTARKFVRENLGWVNNNSWTLVSVEYISTKICIEKEIVR